MPNVRITDLPDAIIPMSLTETFFEVQTVEGGVPVSRRAAGDQLTFTSGFEVEGTSLDDPSIGGGVFNGTLGWQNANDEPTGVLGFEPAGDEFVIQNLAEAGHVSLRVRDGTVHLITADYGVNIPTTGAFKVPAGTTAQEPTPVDGQIRYDSDTDSFRGVIAGVWEDLGSGAEVEGTSTALPSAPMNDFTATLTWVNVDGVELVTVGFPTSDNFVIRSDVHGGEIQLFGETSGGGVATLATFNPDGAAHIYYAGAQVFSTTAVGIEVDEAQINLNNSGTNNDTDLRIRNSVGGLQVRIQDATANLLISQTLANGGIEKTWATATRDGGIGLYFNDSNVFQTDVDGVTLLDGAAANDTQIRFGTVRRGYLGYAVSDNFQVQNDVVSGEIRFTATDSGSGLRTMTRMDPDSGVQLMWIDGQARISTNVTGMIVDGNATIQTTLFRNTGAGASMIEVRNNEGGARFTTDAAGFSIDQITTGSVFEDAWVTGDQNGGVMIFHNNVSMARTVAIGSGGLEVNNTVTGAGFERVLTTSDAGAGSLAALSDVDISGVATGDILYKSAGDWLDANSISLNPGTSVTINEDLVDQVNAGSATMSSKQRNTAGGWERRTNTAGQFFFYQTSSAGAQEDLVEIITRNGNHQWYRDNVLQLTFSSLISTFGDSTSAHRIVATGHNSGVNGGSLQLVAATGGSGGENFLISIAGASKRFALGSQNRLILADDAGVTLNWAGTAIGADLNATGWKVDGTSLDLNNGGNATDATIRVRNSNGGIGIVVEGSTGDIEFQRINATGTDFGSYMTMEQDADVALFFNEIEVARTMAAADGGWEANNTLTGAGFERVLTESDLPATTFVTDVVTSSTLITAATFQVGLMTLALVANARYAVDWCIFHSSPAADDLKVRFNDPGGATWSGLGVWVAGGADEIIEGSPIGSQVDLLAGDGSSHSSFGSMVVNTDGNAGDLSFDIGKISDTGADGNLFAGSWCRAQLLT